jgi:acyl carrier protein phosphodiesterase
MNFLGHCFLTRHDKHLIPGNLAGDFFKGDLSAFKQTPKHIIKGVEIHRFIDSYTDQHFAIQECAHILQNNGIKRISYIATDLLLDHCLAKNWKKFTSKNQGKFIKKIYKITDKNLINLPKEFETLFVNMKHKDWLSRYQFIDGIDLTLYKFGMRLPFNNNLHHTLPVYLDHQKQMDKLFKLFLKDIDQTVKKEFNL